MPGIVITTYILMYYYIYYIYFLLIKNNHHFQWANHQHLQMGHGLSMAGQATLQTFVVVTFNINVRR